MSTKQQRFDESKMRDLMSIYTKKLTAYATR